MTFTVSELKALLAEIEPMSDQRHPLKKAKAVALIEQLLACMSAEAEAKQAVANAGIRAAGEAQRARFQGGGGRY